MLFSINWQGNYAGAQFIPFKLTTSFTENHHSKAMQLQNIYMKSIRGKILSVQNTAATFTSMYDNTQITIADWIKTVTYGDKILFKLVENIDDTKLRIAYNVNDETKATEFAVKVFSIFSNIFGKEVASQVIGDEEKHIKSRNLHQMENEYSIKCAKVIEDNIPTANANFTQSLKKPNKTSLYFGDKNIPTSYATAINNNGNRGNLVNVIEDNQTNQSQTRNTETLASLEQRLSQQFEASMEAKISNVTHKFNANINRTKTELHDNINDATQKLENMIIDKEKDFKAQIGLICQTIETNQLRAEENAEKRSNILRQDYNHILEVIQNQHSSQAPKPSVERVSQAGVGR